MLNVTLLEEGNVKETEVYETIEAVKAGEDVKAFMTFIKENDEAADLEKIEEEIEACETLGELKAVFAEYFDYSWLTLTVEEI